MLLHSVPFKKQTGAALLALMLVLIIVSSYFLVTKLNTNLAKTRQSEETGLALSAAKNALIGYAVSYPDKVNSSFGSGYLPCPDITNNGSAGGSCSLNGTTSIGRFPYKTLEAEDLRDGHGERLWYVVSDNFRNNPKLIPLNSETAGNSSGDMTVDGYADIAAVVFAADAPENSQNRTAANENDYTHYIEAIFSDSDIPTDGILDRIDTADTDRYILLTKDELMHDVEKRVLGEASQFLTAYVNTYGAYPWLTPFADPKSSKPPLSGEHDGGDGSATLSDSSRDFNVWGVAIGDIVRNLIDGSIGMVTEVTTTTLTIAGGLSLGTDNLFDDDDEYYIYPSSLAEVPLIGSAKLIGRATNANDNASLEDANNDFVELGITPGDIVDNLSNGSSGVVDSVSTTELTFLSLTGGATENDFDTNDIYRIRSQHGQATADTDANGLTLEDTNNDFVVMGVLAGDLVVNNSDGSVGRITAVTANQLTVDGLKFGANNMFANGDDYSIPRYNTDNATREGLLSFHEVGKYFPSSFDIDISISALSAADDVAFDNVGYPGVDATYSAALETHIRNYYAAGFNDSLSVSLAEGVCVWLVPDVAECYAPHASEDINISGTVTAGTNTPVIIDALATFDTDGVKRGDIVQNYDDEFPLVPAVSGTADEGGTTGTATAGSNLLLLEDTTKDFVVMGINVGDDVNNISDGSSGVVESVTVDTIIVSSLTGGAEDDFDDLENYEILHSELFDAAATFITNGIVPYNYMVFNTTTGVRAVITDVIDENTLDAVELTNQASPITFSTGDNYTIYTPGIVVVASYDNPTQITTTRTGAYNPDFDLLGTYEEYYRILPAANLYAGVATASSAGNTLEDAAANFINEGITIGDIIENVGDGSSFGEITNVTATTITVAQLYGGTENDFDAGEAYIVYHDYVYSRTHEFHTLFSGDVVIGTSSEKRIRDVCMNYTNNDCINIDPNQDFSGNGGVPLITVRDFEKDGVTEIGRAFFTPSANTEGSMKISNIDYYLQEADGELPDWFITNKWHQLVYVAYSAGDSPNGGATCTIAGTNCLTLTGGGSPNDNKRALIISAGEPLSTQDRTSGITSGYYENENNDAGDDDFQTGAIISTFNDQVRILDTSP